MYTELRSMRCVAQSYPFVYLPAQSLYLKRDHNVKLYHGKKTMAGHIYCIMKRTRHQYHYAVRRDKRRTTETIRIKFAENLTNSKDFWREILKIAPVSRSFSNTIDQVVGSEEVSEIFLTKYKVLFNSVPTSDTDLERLHAVMHDNVEVDNRVNFDIIQRCIKKTQTT